MFVGARVVSMADESEFSGRVSPNSAVQRTAGALVPVNHRFQGYALVFPSAADGGR